MAFTEVFLLGDADQPYSVSVQQDDVAHTWSSARVRNAAGSVAEIDVVLNDVPHQFLVPDGTDRVENIGTFQLTLQTIRGQQIWGAPNLSYVISFGAAARAQKP